MTDDSLSCAGHLAGAAAVLGQGGGALAALIERCGLTAPVLDAAGRGALRRSLESRYIDPVAENGIAAARAATAAAGAEALIAASPARATVLAATVAGAEDARERLFKGLAERGNAISATQFANAGYNIAASVTARALGLRGAALMFAASPEVDRDLLRLAALFFKAGRADLLVLGYADRGAALALVLTRIGNTPVSVPAVGLGVEGLCRLAAGCR